MIKQIEEIPKSHAEKCKSNRQLIRDDIQEALDKNISKFEFIGDYNFKYLDQYAREEAERIWRKLFRDTVLPHYDEWKEKYKTKYIFLTVWEFRRLNPIKVSSIKSDKPGEKRVFCEILDYEAMKKELLAECERVIEGQQKRRDEREKLKMEANDETETFDFSGELP